MINATLHKGKEKQPLNRHSYIFSGAVHRIDGSPEAGDVVCVRTHEGKFIAYGHYNPASGILIRLLEWDENRKVDEDWFREKIVSAIALRKSLFDSNNTDAFRLIFSEGDLLPGLIADKFADTLVLQSHTSGMDRVKNMIAAILANELTGIECVYEKSDGDGRKMEGLPNSIGVLSGSIPDKVTIRENGVKYKVDITSQKTGFYTDQRSNRAMLKKYIKKGDSVLDLFSFTGGFGLNARINGADHVTLCDSSAEALETAKINFRLNGLDDPETVEKDCFAYIRELHQQKKQFDLIIADPPKLMPKKKDEIKAMRAYKDLNFNTMRLVKKGGYMFTFSCSGNFTPEMFKEMIAYSAKDSGRTVQIVEQMHQAPDHPVSVSVPETEYLKGLVLRVL